MFKVLQTTTAEKSCTITALYENFYITIMGHDQNADINYIKIKTLQLMRQYLINEDLVSKLKALINAGKVNVVIECHEKHGIINKLDNLQQVPSMEQERERRKRDCYYDVAYKGISAITDRSYENQVLIPSEYELSEKDIHHMIWEKFELQNIKLVIREIQKEEFDLIKEDIFLISDY